MTATITAMSIAGALSLSAQTPSTPQTPTGPPSTPQTRTEPQTARSGSEQSITVTGCVMENSASGVSGSTGAGTAGAARESGRQAGASNFVLSNAKMSPDSATSALGNMSRVSLTGMSDSDLKKHLNHQVEVTGHLTAGSGMSGAGSAAGSAGAEARSGAMSNTPQLHATSIKMISATCPEK